MLDVIFAGTGGSFEFPVEIANFEIGGFTVGAGDESNIAAKIVNEDTGSRELVGCRHWVDRLRYNNGVRRFWHILM